MLKIRLLLRYLVILMFLLSSTGTAMVADAEDKDSFYKCVLHDTDNKVRDLFLPKHFTFVQRNYIVELCNMVSLQRVDLEEDAYELEREKVSTGGDTGDDELEMRKRLFDIELRSAERKTHMLEQAITAPRFDEEEFWKAWATERHEHAQTVEPYLRESFGKLSERIKRVLDSEGLPMLQQSVP